MKGKYLWVILIVFSLFLRVLASSFLYHTDVKNIYKEANYFNYGIKNSYIEAKKAGDELHYPPAIYLILNAHRSVDAWMFSSHFNDWLKDGTARQAELHPKLFQDLFAMKYPMMLADLVIAVLLVFSVSKAKRRKVAALWLLNPVTIYAVYGFGNFDVLPTLCLTATMFFWFRGNHKLSYLFLGLASGLKLFAILLLPFILVIDKRSIKDKFISLVMFGLGMLPIIGPLFLSKDAFTSVFMSNLSGTLFKTQLYLAEGHVLPIYLIVYFVILGLLYSGKIRLTLPGVVVTVIGLILGMSHFHPQWMLWMTSGLVLLLAKKEISLLYVLVFIFAYFGVSILINDKFVWLGMLKGINEAFDSIKPIRFYADAVGLGTQVQGMLQSVFLASAVLLSMESMGSLKIKNFRFPSRIVITWLIGAWVLFIPLSFVVAHIPLIKYGRYIDTERMDQREKIVLTSKTTIKQMIMPNHDRMSAVLLKMKNVGLVNQDNLIFTIEDDSGNDIRTSVISGRTIGDDFDMIVYFDPIDGTKGKKMFITLSQPGATLKSELQVPFNQESSYPGLYVNGGEVRGSLAYTLYYNPGSLGSNIAWSLNNIFTKLK